MNIRNLLIGAAAAAALTTLAGAANAATTATETASATIVAPTSVQGTQSLAFGTIAKPSNNGSNSVTVGADPSVTSPTIGSEGGNAYITQSGQAHAAIFHLTGAALEGISATATLDFVGDNANLGITSTTAAAILPASIPALSQSGTEDLPVGGVITVTNNTPVKTYTGTLTVNVSFN